MYEEADGSIWVGGTTDSPDFPTTAKAFMAPNPFRSDAFAAQLDAGGEIPMQFLCVDPAANALGIVTTNGLAAMVRW